MVENFGSAATLLCRLEVSSLSFVSLSLTYVLPFAGELEIQLRMSNLAAAVDTCVVVT